MKAKDYKFIWPRVTDEVKAAVMAQLDKGEVSIYDRSGVFAEFEDKFAKYYGAQKALLFSSGTASLHASMVGCGFGPGDEVIVPTYTFFASVTPLFQTGAVPVLVDCDEKGNIDPSEIEKKINKKTKGVIVTHMWGVPVQIVRIREICDQHGLKLIEDCSHAHGAKVDEKLVGTFGDVAAFSLQGQKIITGGEGGVIITNNQEIYERALMLGHYNKRCKQELKPDSVYYSYAVTGFGLKLRAHPWAIAMAMEQFGHLDEWHKIMNTRAAKFRQMLERINGIKCLNIPENVEPSWYAFPIQVDNDLLGVGAKEFTKLLNEAGIADADMPGSTCPIHTLAVFQKPEVLFPQYKDLVTYKLGDFPNAEKFFSITFKLPIDPITGPEFDEVLEDWARIIAETVNKLTSTK